MTEPAKKKQTLFSSMFKNVPNTYEASSSDPTPLLNNTADTSKAKKRTEPEVSCIFEIESYLLCRERERGRLYCKLLHLFTKLGNLWAFLGGLFPRYSKQISKQLFLLERLLLARLLRRSCL